MLKKTCETRSSHLRNVSDHVEGDLGQVVVLAAEDLREPADGLLHRDELASVSGKDLGDLEWLREEPLDLASAGDGQLVLLGQLVHT